MEPRRQREKTTYVFVEDEDVGTSLVKSMGGTEARKTASDDDDASHGI